jgi:hypothetical protein
MPNTTSLNYKIEDLFVRFHYKLRSNLKNNGNALLGTDVLRDNKKKNCFLQLL